MPAKVAVVKATELIPKAFNGTVAVPEEKSDDLLYDLHHLAAVDSHPVSSCVRCACVLAVPVTKILPNLPSTPLIVFYARIHGMFAGFQEKGGGLYSNNLSCPCDRLNPAENI